MLVCFRLLPFLLYNYFCFFLSAGNAGSVFSIYSFGNITVAKKLDRETKSAYELTVTAQDRAGTYILPP